jgi:hypothetical protein
MQDGSLEGQGNSTYETMLRKADVNQSLFTAQQRKVRGQRFSRLTLAAVAPCNPEMPGLLLNAIVRNLRPVLLPASNKMGTYDTNEGHS